MDGRFHVLTKLPNQMSIVSNFGQHDDFMFWQVTTDSKFKVEYDRVEAKPLKHQWNKMLGPISLPGVDLFNIQYDCINGKDNQVLDFLNNFLRWRTMSTWLSWSGT